MIKVFHYSLLWPLFRPNIPICKHRTPARETTNSWKDGAQMPYDSVPLEQSEYVSDNRLLQLLDIDVKKTIARFILRHDSGEDL